MQKTISSLLQSCLKAVLLTNQRWRCEVMPACVDDFLPPLHRVYISLQFGTTDSLCLTTGTSLCWHYSIFRNCFSCGSVSSENSFTKEKITVGWGPCLCSLCGGLSSNSCPFHTAAFPSLNADHLWQSLAQHKGNIEMSCQFWQHSLTAKHMCMHVPCWNSYRNSCPISWLLSEETFPKSL